MELVIQPKNELLPRWLLFSSSFRTFYVSKQFCLPPCLISDLSEFYNISQVLFSVLLQVLTARYHQYLKRQFCVYRNQNMFDVFFRYLTIQHNKCSNIHFFSHTRHVSADYFDHHQAILLQHKR